MILYFFSDDSLQLFSDLNNGAAESKLYSVFTHTSLPERWRYRANPRAGSIVVVADKGAVFYDDLLPFVKYATKEFGRSQELTNVYGWNGYDNKYGEMHTPLILYGPAFQVSEIKETDSMQ